MVTANPVAVIVLAAGAGTRMKSKLPKVLHPVCGTSMLLHAINAAAALNPAEIVAVVRHEREQVVSHLVANAPDVIIADQDEIPGTGRAVQCALEKVSAESGTVLVSFGDVPLLEAETLKEVVELHENQGSAVTILSAKVDNPFGYGRIVRSADGSTVLGIVEEKDATDAERQITEINSGVAAFDLAFLRQALTKVGTDNSQGEMYLTDVPKLAVKAGKLVLAHQIADAIQVEGANDRYQLSQLAAEMNHRILKRHMQNGVSIVDPNSTFIDASVEIAQDVTILPGVQLKGATKIAQDAVVGPDSTLTDVVIGAGAEVVRTHGMQAEIGAGATVGPFSYLRPGAVLAAKSKVGAYVEIKNSQIGEGAKVPHLSYVGDAEIGEGTNIGAATIFANYDGVKKHRSKVGKHVRIGSDSVLVAPVTVGDGAITGAGTLIREDIAPGALMVNDVKPKVVEGWIFEKRAGTEAAEAAEAAQKSDSE